MSNNIPTVYERLARVEARVVGEVVLVAREHGAPLRMHYCLDHIAHGAPDLERLALYGADLAAMPYVECVSTPGVDLDSRRRTLLLVSRGA